MPLSTQTQDPDAGTQGQGADRPPTSERRPRDYALPLIILAIGWAVCGLAVLSVRKERDAADLRSLGQIAMNTESHITDRISSYSHALDAVASYYSAFKGISRAQWVGFAEALDVPDRYPGLRGIGIMLPVDDAALGAFSRMERADGAPDFTIHAVPGRSVTGPDHAIVAYVEPPEVNRRTLRLDEFSEPNRREAALAARDSGTPRMTRRVALVHEKAADSSSLFYVPVYRPGSHPSTVEERRASFLAWTFTPFVFKELLQQVMENDPPKLRLWFYEGADPEPQALLFASDPAAAPGPFELTTHLEFGGQEYTLGWERGPAFVPSPLSPRLWTAAIGAFASLLLARLIYDLIRRRSLLEEEVRWRTAQLRQSEERFRTYVDQAADALFVHDGSGRFIDVNQRACTSFGYGREELLRMSFADIGSAPHADAARAPWDGVVPGRPSIVTGQFRRKDGSSFPVEVQFGCFDLSGRRYYMGMVRDITERRRSEQALHDSEAQLRQAQKMEAVGQLAGGVAHDFNNILTAFLLNICLLRDDAGLSAESRSNLQELEREASRAAALTRQLLYFSRQQAMHQAPTDLNALVGNLLRMLRRLLGENIAIEWHAKEHLPTIQADPGMIEQVVMNLCVNARDAMPAGGLLTLRTDEVAVDTASPSSGPDARTGVFARLSVSDTGSGMDAHTRRHLFEPFFTTKEQGKGTGLGLATVYGIVKQHNGWIELETAPGRGSTFHVILPLKAEAPAVAEDAGAAEMPRGRGETVLVVEDEAAIRRVMVLTLQRYGYAVVEASSGPDALRQWEHHHAAIRMVVTDMVMPGGQDGNALIRRLKALKPGLKAIIVSGYMPHKLESAELDAPFLAKPFSMQALLALVREGLDPAAGGGRTAGTARAGL